MTNGDFVRLTYNGRTVRAMVLLVSRNQRSVALGFGDALCTSKGDAFAGTMALLQDDAGIYRDLIRHEPATIEPEQ